MSTRSTIWLRIRPEDFGKVMIADIEKLPNPMEEFNYPCKEVKIPDNPGGGVLYMGIYCHSDGYPDGVGAELEEKFTTYEQVLNLILLGQCSYIIDKICSYHNWRNENLYIYKTEYGKPECKYDYAYLFEGDRWSHVNGIEHIIVMNDYEK